MIDWHSHILPGMDDGSRSVEESLTMLHMLSEQGISTVVALPHFYANDESVASFLERREEKYTELSAAIDSGCPRIMLGAEVRYYPGIGKMDELLKLCIKDSNILMLEMPMGRWTEYTQRELVEMASARGIRLALAHIERYLPMQSAQIWQRLRESGIMMQVNASYFNDFLARRKALSLLQNGGIDILGSDCHGASHRPPHLGKALEIIRRKFGDEFVQSFIEYGYSILGV